MAAAGHGSGAAAYHAACLLLLVPARRLERYDVISRRRNPDQYSFPRHAGETLKIFPRLPKPVLIGNLVEYVSD